MSAEVLEQMKQEMEQTLGSLRVEFSKVRTGRASTSLIEGVMVQYYGSPTPLNPTRFFVGTRGPSPRCPALRKKTSSVMWKRRSIRPTWA